MRWACHISVCLKPPTLELSNPGALPKDQQSQNHELTTRETGLPSEENTRRVPVVPTGAGYPLGVACEDCDDLPSAGLSASDRSPVPVASPVSVASAHLEDSREHGAWLL